MTLSPEDREAVIQRASEALASELRRVFDVAEIFIVPLSSAAQAIGLSTKQTARVLPVVSVGPKTRGVRLARLQAYLTQREKQPQ